MIPENACEDVVASRPLPCVFAFHTAPDLCAHRALYMCPWNEVCKSLTCTTHAQERRIELCKKLSVPHIMTSSAPNTLGHRRANPLTPKSNLKSASSSKCSGCPSLLHSLHMRIASRGVLVICSCWADSGPELATCGGVQGSCLSPTVKCLRALCLPVALIQNSQELEPEQCWWLLQLLQWTLG